MTIKSLSLALLLSGLAWIPSACSWQKKEQPSILVIAIEELGFSNVSCSADGRDEGRSGLEILCEESVRFTHAYTPSTLSTSAMTSLLTARYPMDHGVRNNGSAFLSARFQTIPEVALERGYRTAFFGGGPPVWRNAGINQGFETYEDNLSPHRMRLYRPAIESVSYFLNWRESLPSSSPFFAVLYFTDAQFKDSSTFNDLGELRGSNYRSQVEEISESLETLIEAMKKDKIWDNTHVIVTGLNGHAEEDRPGEARQVNLYGERTRVVLFIKPARRSHEGEFNWKVDSSVSLVDVGATLLKLFNAKIPSASDSVLNPVPLTSIFSGPQPDWKDKRAIWSESDWPQWRGFGARRVALRIGPLLYIHDYEPKLFNTLTDPLEASPLPLDDLRYVAAIAPFRELVSRMDIDPYVPLSSKLVAKLELGQEFWRFPMPTGETVARLKKMSNAAPKDLQLLDWRASNALRVDDWGELRGVALKANQPDWLYVAARNFRDKTGPPNDPCLRIFANRKHLPKAPTIRECSDQELLDLFVWSDETVSSGDRQAAMERFFRSINDRLLENRVAEQNYALGLVWNRSLGQPAGPMISELVLALPEYQKYRQMLRRRLGENRQSEDRSREDK